MKFTYSKKEKLKSKKLITKLFEEGKSVSAFPLKLIYLQTKYSDDTVTKTMVSVGKRNFKHAVDRNQIKRLLRESYRVNKETYFNNLTTQYAFMILYIGKERPTLVQIESRMKRLFKKFSDKIS